MRTLIAAMIVACLVGGCLEEQKLSAWGLGGSDVDGVNEEIIGRLGIANPGGVEFGAESLWQGIHGHGQAYGAYILTDLPETPLGTPYVGYHATVAHDADLDGGLYGPIAGTVVMLGGLETVVEYQYRDYNGSLSDLNAEDVDRHKVFAGFRIRF